MREIPKRVRCESVSYIYGEDGKHFRYAFRFVTETGAFTGSWDSMNIDRDASDAFDVGREYDLNFTLVRAADDE